MSINSLSLYNTPHSPKAGMPVTILHITLNFENLNNFAKSQRYRDKKEPKSSDSCSRPSWVDLKTHPMKDFPWPHYLK